MQIAVKPVAVFPGIADTFELNPCGFGPPPAYYFSLKQSVAPIKEGDPITYIRLKEGNASMTDEQWNAWSAGSGGDDAYQLSAIAANLGLTTIS